MTAAIERLGEPEMLAALRDGHGALARALPLGADRRGARQPARGLIPGDIVAAGMRNLGRIERCGLGAAVALFAAPSPAHGRRRRPTATRSPAGASASTGPPTRCASRRPTSAATCSTSPTGSTSPRSAGRSPPSPPRARRPSGRVQGGAGIGLRNATVSGRTLELGACSRGVHALRRTSPRSGRSDATGKPFKGSTPYTEATGLADMHNHVSAYEFLGGQRPLRAAVASLRGDAGAGRLPRPLPGRLRGDPREPLLRRPDPQARPGRLAHLRRLARLRLAHPRADLLALARARLARRRAADGQQPGRERRALPRLPLQAELLRRVRRRAAPGAAHVRAPGLHRRPVRRSRRGLLPDRHQPLPGAPRDQRRQARDRPRDRGIRAVRLHRVPGRAAVHDRGREGRDRGVQGARRQLALPDPQVRQRLRRHPLRRRRGRRRDQRGPVRPQRPLLGGRGVPGAEGRQHGRAGDAAAARREAPTPSRTRTTRA